jgi:chromate reductase
MAATYRIGYFVGSLASGSINRTLSKALIKLAPSNLEFTEIPIKDLPLYSYDYDADFPAEGRAVKDAIEACDGILFISPEYNRSIPGGFEERHRLGLPPLGIQFVRPQTKRHHRCLARRHRHSRHAIHNARGAELPWRPAAERSGSLVQFKPEIFGDDGAVTDESTAAFLRHYMDEYGAFVERVLAANAPGHIGDTHPALSR